MDCPICDWNGPYKSVVWHVYYRHLCGNGGRARCWCGFEIRWEIFVDHIEHHGGLLAHYLEHAVGVK